MSRGGRRGGRGGGRRGPDLSWDDSEAPPSSTANKPAPTFPKLDLPTPKPLSSSEQSAVDHYLSFRKKIHSSSVYAILDPSSLTDDKGRVDKRAGFDPFNDQERYNTPLLQQRRTIPDLSGREYALQFFPKELWPLLDPKRRNSLWKNVDGADKNKVRKRKRPIAEVGDGVGGASGDAPIAAGERENTADEDDDSDVIVTGGRRQPKPIERSKSRKKRQPTNTPAKQKQGLDAEDDFPEDQDEDDEMEEGERDSEFEEEEEEDEGNDYNAEQYFDAGDEDEGWGGDEDGGAEERTYRE